MKVWLARLPAGGRVLLGLTIATALLFTLAVPAAPVSAWTTPPAPTLVDVNPNGNEGDWLIGAIPPDYDPSKPVLVFVQGLHGQASNWWGPTAYYGDNDMYAYAYNNGYRTAFVQFRDADGNAGSMWRNGSVLRQQLEAITKYFGVPRVNIVGHSKGGVDSNSAIVHYGAYPYVQNVFTLATPHRGSELADLAYSWWAWWLAALLGQLDDGTYVMQTSYMDYFRSVTDYRPEDANIRYYTGAGLDWGPWFSALWFGGGYLWWYDDNDGVVCHYSAHGHPAATRVFTDGNLNHDNIRMGSRSWNYIAPYVSYYRTIAGASPVVNVASRDRLSGLAALAAATASKSAVAPAPVPGAAGFIRGGPLDGHAEVTFQVESGVSGLSVNVLVGRTRTTATLVGPDGSRVALAGGPGVAEYDEVFGGVNALGARIRKPAAGRWMLELAATSGSDAYLARIGFEGGAEVSLVSGPEAVYAPGEQVTLSVKAVSGLDGSGLGGLAVDGVAVATSPGKGSLGGSPDYGLKARFRLAPVESAAGQYEGGFRLPGREGVYNLTIDLSGKETDGTSFQRTLVVSILVLRPDHRNAAGLRALAGE